MNPPPHRSPVARVPWWLRRLMPDATGLAENPLFIRYSCQGFGKRRRLFPRWTREFAFPWPGIGLRIGVMPFVCFAVAVLGGTVLDLLRQAFGTWYFGRPLPADSATVSSMSSAEIDEIVARANRFPYKLMDAWYESGIVLVLISAALGLWILAARLLGISAERRLATYARNARGAEWGEDLALTRLSAEEFGAALIGGTLMAALGAYRVVWGLFVAIILALISVNLATWVFVPTHRGELEQMLVALIAYLGFASAAAWEACGLAIFMAAAHARALARTEGRFRGGIKQACWIAGALLACHAPSLLGLAAYNWIDTKFRIARGSSPDISQDLIPAVMTCAAAALAAWLLFRMSRNTIQLHRIALGEKALAR